MKPKVRVKRGYKYIDDYGCEQNAIFVAYCGNPDDIDMEDVETGIDGFLYWTTKFLDRDGNEI